jgi:hypothetical protein
MSWKINFSMVFYSCIYLKSINEPWRTILNMLLTFYAYVNDYKILSFSFSFLGFSFLLVLFDYSLFIYKFLFSLELTHRTFTSTNHILGSLSFLSLNNNTIKYNKNSIDRFVLFFFLILQHFYIVLHRIESFYFSQGV